MESKRIKCQIKKVLLLFPLLLIYSATSSAQFWLDSPLTAVETNIGQPFTPSLTSRISSDQKEKKKRIDLDDFLDVLGGPSEIFVPGSDFLWGTYSILSNYGLRDDKERTLIPPISLHYEYSLIANFGLRLEAGANHWEENKVLVRSSDRDFRELFEYRYWTLGIGLTYHLNAGLDWDPYIGYAYTYRRGRAFCDCIDETLEQSSQDVFGGIRYFVTNALFLQAEIGATGVGVLEIGLGFQFF
jgi:hypothetical protein